MRLVIKVTQIGAFEMAQFLTELNLFSTPYTPGTCFSTPCFVVVFLMFTHCLLLIIKTWRTFWRIYTPESSHDNGTLNRFEDV